MLTHDQERLAFERLLNELLGFEGATIASRGLADSDADETSYFAYNVSVLTARPHAEEGWVYEVLWGEDGPDTAQPGAVFLTGTTDPYEERRPGEFWFRVFHGEDEQPWHIVLIRTLPSEEPSDRSP